MDASALARDRPPPAQARLRTPSFGWLLSEPQMGLHAHSRRVEEPRPPRRPFYDCAHPARRGHSARSATPDDVAHVRAGARVGTGGGRIPSPTTHIWDCGTGRAAGERALEIDPTSDYAKRQLIGSVRDERAMGQAARGATTVLSERTNGCVGAADRGPSGRCSSRGRLGGGVGWCEPSLWRE